MAYPNVEVHEVATHHTFSYLRRYLTSPCHVLEVGCGKEAHLAYLLNRMGFTVTAVDPNLDEKHLKQNSSTLQFFRSSFDAFDAKTDPLLKNKGYDAILFIRSLHHIPELEPTLDKIDLLLVPGGFLCLEEFWREKEDPKTITFFFETLEMLNSTGVLNRQKVLSSRLFNPNAPHTHHPQHGHQEHKHSHQHEQQHSHQHDHQEQKHGHQHEQQHGHQHCHQHGHHPTPTPIVTETVSATPTNPFALPIYEEKSETENKLQKYLERWRAFHHHHQPPLHDIATMTSAINTKFLSTNKMQQINTEDTPYLYRYFSLWLNKTEGEVDEKEREKERERGKEFLTKLFNLEFSLINQNTLTPYGYRLLCKKSN